MNRHGAIDIDWGDGTHTFRLGLDQIEELEEKRDLSLFSLARRLSPETRDARLSDIRETLRIGLIGGETSPLDALALVRRYVDERPLDESRDVAFAVALAGLARVRGDEVDPSGEAPGVEPSASTSPKSEQAQL